MMNKEPLVFNADYCYVAHELVGESALKGSYFTVLLDCFSRKIDDFPKYLQLAKEDDLRNCCIRKYKRGS